jgi:hypothetical protein
MEKLSFEGQISPEGGKAPFRRMAEKQSEELKKLKSSRARWGGLAAAKLTERATEE